MKLFARQRTERGRSIIEDWAENTKTLWMRVFIYLLTGEYEKALSLGQAYLAANQEIHADNVEEVGCGLAVLKLIYTHMTLPEEAASVDERFESIRDQIGDVPIFRRMIDAFYDLAVAYQGQDDPRNDQRAFLSAFAALALSVSVYKRLLPPELMGRLFVFFQDLGFPRNRWGWLTRRANFLHTDFVGLVSVLIEEGLFPSGTTELPYLSEPESADGKLGKNYEIARMLQQSWMSSGFTEDIAISLAEGELSTRVERLIDEGGRCLRDVGELSDLVLFFSSHSTGTHITILERDISSDERRSLSDRIFCGILAERGADSVMWLSLAGTTLSISDKSLIPLRDTDADEEIHVEARDSKSYIAGVQHVRRTSTACEFGEPILSDAEDGSFSKFTFPLKPITKKTEQKTDEDEKTP
jgi:hypothetical protein